MALVPDAHKNRLQALHKIFGPFQSISGHGPGQGPMSSVQDCVCGLMCQLQRRSAV